MILFVGTGTTGRAALDALGREGVRALVRSPEKAAALGADLEVVVGDAADRGSLGRALDGVDSIFLSTNATPALPDLHAGIVEAAKNAGVKRIVKVSVTGAHPRAKFRFAAVHGQSDRLIQDSGLGYTLLRPCYFLQNLLGLAAAIQAQGALALPIGAGKMPVIDVRDIGAVAAKVLRGSGSHDGKVYDLTGSESLSGDEIAAVMSRALGRPIAFASPDPAHFRQAMLGVGAPEWIVDGVIEMFSIFAGGFAGKTTGTVRELLGRDPITLERFISDHAVGFGASSAAVAH